RAAHHVRSHRTADAALHSGGYLEPPDAHILGWRVGAIWNVARQRLWCGCGSMPWLFLISPSHFFPDGRLVKTTRYWTSGLTMPALKALTPKDWRVTLVDELVSPVDMNHHADVVGIGAMGPQIGRAYELADAFRARGKKVVLGGPWVTLA